MLFVTIMILAVTVGELGKTFNIVGAVASNSIGFILPALYYVILVHKKKKPKLVNFYGAVVLFSLAVPFGVLAVVCEFVIFN